MSKIKYKLDPWVKHWYTIRRRCNNPCEKDIPYYKDIECLITKEELEYLWKRDKAYDMKYPTIDRKNESKHYTLNNCQFLEMRDNVIKRNKKYGKPILQYDLEGNFLREWSSAVKACKNRKISNITINANLKGRLKTAGGFIWRYKNV